jgi:hypothetical protein
MAVPTQPGTPWGPILKAVLLQQAIGHGVEAVHTGIKNHLREKARKIYAASENPVKSDHVYQTAKNKFGLKTQLIKTDNAMSRTIGPAFYRRENAVVGPSGPSRAVKTEGVRLLGSLDDPAAVAHELGHAVAYKQTPWAHTIERPAKIVGAFGLAAGRMAQSPGLAAMMIAAQEAPNLIEEHRANNNAHKILNHAVGNAEAKKLMRVNRMMEGAGVSKALINTLVTHMLTPRKAIKK